MVIRVFPRLRAVLISTVAVVVLTTATAHAGDPHTVAAGETLSHIAANHGTTVAALVEANGIANPNHIVVGTTLTIPGGNGAGSGPTTVSYVVRPGDTLAAIASKFGTTVSAIVEANDISNPNLIIAGRTIVIPSSSGGGAPVQTVTAPPTSGGGDFGPQLPGQRHTVQSGESLGSIAAKYGMRSADIASWNGIIDGRIYATTRLLLYYPGPGPVVTGGGGTSTHVVTSGESLASIASKYGTTVAKIAGANDISNPNLIVIGQKLTIPGAAGGLVCMVPGATFFNDWAFPRSGGRSHAGNDLFAARGTPILAPVSGAISQSTGSIGGKQVRLVDATGAMWFASHMDDFGKSGQVSAGDIVGYVGDSGNAKGSRPHAHVEYHAPNGNAVNPYPALRQVC